MRKESVAYDRSMSANVNSLGLIAGNRSLPLMVASGARAAGVQRIVVAAFENETDPALAQQADTIRWFKVGQLSALIDFFRDNGVRQCVMAGQIAPKRLWDLRPDLRAAKLLLRLKEKNAHSLFGGIAEELSKDGIDLVPAMPWLSGHMPSREYRLGPKPDADLLSDIEFGFRMAKEVSRLEIGQLVVVKGGTVLAVEGFEGTDACLQRGGTLAGEKGGAVAVKVAKRNHDLRFDIPCIGATTLQTCADHGIRALAIEAGRTVLMDAAEVRTIAERNRLSLVGWAGDS